MANIAGFDANKQGDMQNFDVIPAHKALMMATASEMKPTKDGTGQRLTFTLDIMEGQYKGRKMFVGLNLVNRNKQAEDISARELGALCRAVGVDRPNDSIELHGKLFVGDIGVKPAKGAQPPSDGKPARDAQPEQNYMKGYAPAGSDTTMPNLAMAGTHAASAPITQAGAPPTGPADAPPPWLKK